MDLKLEGPAWKISRKQGVIKLRNTGEFYIANEGKRCIFVDGKPVSFSFTICTVVTSVDFKGILSHIFKKFRESNVFTDEKKLMESQFDEIFFG